MNLRDFEDQKAYDIHKEITTEFFDDIDEYIKLLVFDSEHSGRAISKNRFPYKDYHENHYILWIQPRYNEFYDDGRIISIVGHNELIFKNTCDKKSIQGIEHYHIIYYNNE